MKHENLLCATIFVLLLVCIAPIRGLLAAQTNSPAGHATSTTNRSSVISLMPVVKTNLTLSVSGLTDGNQYVTAPASSTYSGSVRLKWDRSPDPDVAGYAVYASLSRVQVLRADAGTNTSVTISGLTEGVTYTLTCVAYNLAGVESIPSNEVTYKAPIRTSIRNYAYAVETYGLAQVTNLIVSSTNLVDWKTEVTFVGDGKVKSLIATNNASSKYYKTIKK